MDKETKALIAEATEGLKSKNKALLNEVKQLKALTSALDGVDLQQLMADAKELKKLKTNKDKEEGNYKKLYEEQKTQHATEKQQLEAERDAALTEAVDLKKGTALQQAYNKVHVDPLMAESATIIHMPHLAVTEQGEIMVGEKTVEDYVKEWAGTEVGKRFVLDGNDGGDASGQGGKHSQMADFFNPKSDAFNRTKQAQIAKDNPDAYKKYKKMYA